jgi:hypothetical protein
VASIITTRAKVRRVEDVLAADAQEELARDGHHRGQQGQHGITGAEQQAERQAGDQGALGIEAGQFGELGGGPLGEQRRREDGHRPARVDIEAEPGHTVDEQAGQHRDLVQAGIDPRRGLDRNGRPVNAHGRHVDRAGRMGGGVSGRAGNTNALGVRPAEMIHARLDGVSPGKFPAPRFFGDDGSGGSPGPIDLVDRVLYGGEHRRAPDGPARPPGTGCFKEEEP